MYRKPYEDLLRSWGYHGTYILVTSSSWHTTFWKGEYKIWLNIYCKNRDVAYDDIKHDFLKVLMFAGTEPVKNIAADDDIEALLFTYLSEQADFKDVRYEGKVCRHIHANKDGKAYSFQLGMQTEENHSLDKYDEDHDGVLDYCEKEFAQKLSGNGLSDSKVQVSPDFLSINVSLRFDQRLHHLCIHAFYNDWFADWENDALAIIVRYRDIRSDYGYVSIRSFEEYLQQYGFSEIKSTSDGLGNIEVLAYYCDNKFSIKVRIENEEIPADNIKTVIGNAHIPVSNIKPKIETIPFDNMEGHEFEFFCAEVLAKNGFENISVTKGSGDQGVDIIAYKDDVKYGIQCKCYTQDIGNKAVQEVFAGKTFYQCHVGVVLTNRYFRESAKELAKRSGVILWDRDKLIKMVENYNEPRKV